MTATLTIDSGNTRIKWGFHDKGLWLFTGCVLQGDRDSLVNALSVLPDPGFIIVSNVAGNETRQMLCHLLSTYRAKTYWVSAASFQCGVYNQYQDPTQLGSDRWAALIAAWHSYSQACIVVCVGTTMTVDMLSNAGEFRGGLILPGPNIMFDSLYDRTALLGTCNGHFVDFPLCTADAIQTGVIHSLVGAIERVYHLFSAELNNSTPVCVISGGALAIIQPHINIPIKVSELLVLDGLLLLAHDVNPVAT